MLCTFVAVTVILEFYKGAKAIVAKSGQSLLMGMMELTHRNTRRYGGYLVHMGVVVLFVGFTGKAFDLNSTVELETGHTLQLGHFTMRAINMESGQNNNFQWSRLNLAISKDGQDLGTMSPERRFYLASKQPTSEVAIRRRLDQDLYVNYAGPSDDGKKAVIQAFVNPLVSWVWIGYWVVLIGTLICMVPSKTKLVFPRTEVVGIAKHEAVRNEKAEN
jgi:cytochrome c-type biogenesis protein CcmF